MHRTIAIDGPVGAGKSTVAEDVARALGIPHLDTGAMYRALGWLALRDQVKLEDERAVSALARGNVPEVRFDERGEQQTWIAGQDATALIRTEAVGQAASLISKYAEVREVMVERQRELSHKQSMVLDGRDIGTRVLPDAALKIYLTAQPEARAMRRYEELRLKDESLTYETVLADLRRRDEQDMNREVDPLRPADDAQLLDTSELTQAQVVAEIIRRAELKSGHPPKPSEPFTPLYKAARVIACFLFTTLLPVKYHHIENVQLDAPYILIGNHHTMLDPQLVGWKCYRYQVRFLGKKELAENPVMKRLFKGLRMIPVNRHNMDLAALRTCLKTLKEGHVLGIFPEGTRHKIGEMENLESGAALIALRSGARIVPAYISSPPKLFRRIHVYYGEPISVAAIAAKGVNKDTCDELLALIRTTYREMIERHEKFSGKDS